MDWRRNLSVPFVPRATVENSRSFLYNYSCDHHHFAAAAAAAAGLEAVAQHADNCSTVAGAAGMSMYGGHDLKKNKLSSEQLLLLEKSFQEDMKLDPDRKMRLAKELRLQPRQIAVWFQNRRARWKGKQLELLYETLKQEYDIVSREKQKLQQEVMALRSILTNGLISAGYTETGKTAEGTSKMDTTTTDDQINAECDFVFNVEDYNLAEMTTPYNWDAMP